MKRIVNRDGDMVHIATQYGQLSDRDAMQHG